MRKTILLILHSNLRLWHRLPRFLLCLCLISITFFANAQSTVTGKVTDENGSGMPGVNVIVKGTSTGTSTDANGAYSLNASEVDILVFSFIGYTTEEISVGTRTTIDISLTASIESLTEIVVVGYGTQKKADLTGAVSSVDLRDLPTTPHTNLGQFLQGTVPGLNVGVATTAGGTPPISIRGRVTLNGSQDPVIIVDGIQFIGSLSSLNPDDIATIDVLKDASSTAVYGAQAANGVILITSKKGSTGKAPSISFKTMYTSQEPTNGDFVPNNREQYLAGVTEAFYTLAYTPESNYTEPNPAFDVKNVVDGSMRDTNGDLLPNDFNWWDAGTETGSIFESTLSITGGTDKINYLLSGGLVDQKGFIVNDKFKRKTLRANLEIAPFSWWKVGLVSSGSFVNQDGAEPSLASLIRASPLHVPFDANGNLIISPTNTIELNPFAAYYVDDLDRHNYYFANVYTEIDFPFLKGLKYRMNFGNNYRTDKHYYASKYDAGQTGRAYKDDQEYYDYTFDNIVSYTNTFGKHEVGATLLYGAIERKFTRNYVEGTGFTRLTLSYNDISQATTQRVGSPSATTPNAWEETLNYQMARVNYKYGERYLVTATVRRDGFSGFAKNYKSAVFPSASLGWIISEEQFMQNVSKIDQLKIRVGYGEIGNQTSRYSSLARLTTSAAYVYGDNTSTQFGQQVSTLGNDDLKWERTKGLNVGLDFGLFNSKTSGSLEFYNNNTYDLIFNVQIPSTTGFDLITSNLGQINNKGFEAKITQQILEKGDLSWSATLIFASNKNEIVTLTGQDLNGDGKEDDLISSGLFIGKSIQALYDYQTDGVYDLDDTRLPGFPIGSMRVVDQDGDGDITALNDRVFIGRQEPTYRWSLLNNVSYKGFTLGVFINAVQGTNNSYMGINRPFANNTPQYWREDNTIRWNDFVGMDYWSPTNPDGKYPRVISGAHAKAEPGMYQDRSFVRLQDISLSYNLASTVLKKLNAKDISVFVSGKNLATWTKWEGWDPESVITDPGNAANNRYPNGLVAGGRPVLRSFSVGLNFTY